MLNVAEGTNRRHRQPTRPGRRQRRQPAAAPVVPQGAGAGHRLRAVQRGAQRRAGHGRQRPVPARARSATWRTPATRRSTPTPRRPSSSTCLPETARTRSTLSFNTTNDPFNVESNSLILSMWQEAFGDQIDATIAPIEQGQYIGLALAGDFEVFPWRSHSGSDPDQQRRWWYVGDGPPIGDGRHELRPLRRPGDRREPRHHPHERATPTPAARRPRRSTGASASRSTTSG